MLSTAFTIETFGAPPQAFGGMNPPVQFKDEFNDPSKVKSVPGTSPSPSHKS